MKREEIDVPSKTSRFTSRIVSLAKKAVVGEPEPALQPGQDGFADWVSVALEGLHEFLDHSYRMLLDVLREMPDIVAKLELEVNELPHFTTVCTRKQDLKMPIWRFLLRCSTDLHETGEIQAIDSTGIDRHAASQHYANRTDYTFRAVKTTALVDCKTSVILDIHCSMKQPNDTKVGWKLLTRNLDKMTILAADKGFDWNDLRDKLRENGVRPVIKHREHWSLDAAHNARIDDEVYHQRSNIESVFFALRREFGDTLRARTWFGQFRELILKAAVRNVKLSL